MQVEGVGAEGEIALDAELERLVDHGVGGGGV
jgi:hypothetical protein